MGKSRFGNITELPSGKWRARFRDKDSVVTKTLNTWDEASAYLAEMQHRKATGSYITASKNKLTLADVGERWIEGLGDKKLGTIVEQRRIYERAIKPLLGRATMAEINLQFVRKWMRQMELSGVAANTRKNRKNVLSLILQEGVEMGCRIDNPCRQIKVRSAEREEQVFLTHSEVHKIVKVIPKPYDLAVRLSAYCGLRAGEVWALRVKSIDFESGRLSVVKNVRRVTGHGLVEELPKSWQRRSVVVPTELLKDLKEHVKLMKPNSLVFTSATGAIVSHDVFGPKTWKQAIAASGIEKNPRFHDLRHTCAAFYFARKATGEEVRRVLGHGSVSETSKTYAHVFPEAFDMTVRGIDEDIAAGLNEDEKTEGLFSERDTSVTHQDINNVSRES